MTTSSWRPTRTSPTPASSPTCSRRNIKRKHENARQLRLKHARIPELLVIETYPFERQPKLNKKKLMALYDSLGYLHQHQNLIWLGVTGCGKTGLATSFLIHAIDQGYRGRYVLFAELIDELYAAVADHSENRVLRNTWPLIAC